MSIVASGVSKSALALAYMPAHEQLRLFRAKQLSPVEILRAQISQIEAIGASINAVTYSHLEEALIAAEESEARYHRGNPRPLDGISVAVKDEYDKGGWIVTAGSVLLRDSVKHENHPVVVDKLLEAGAVLHLQTAAPEFYLVAVTWSDLWGVTRNPWNLDCTPGGSSGGSAAVLGAGMATLAIGSDMGGSIRIPCALNGLYGSKPSYGRIASPDPSALVPHASPGPLARDVRDMILLQNVMCGPAPGCPAVLRPRLELPLNPSPRAFRMALSMDQGWATLEADVRANTLAAAKLLEGAGATVDEVELPLATNDARLREAIEKGLFSTAIGADLVDLHSKAEKMTTYGRHFVKLACAMGPRDAREAAEEALRLYRILDERVFEEGYDALLTPTVATTRIAADYDPTRDVPVINGKKVDPYSGWFLTSVFSLLNWMPVVTVPTGLAANKVPTGMQIACRPYDDATAAAVATLYAEAAPPMPFDRVIASAGCGRRS